MGGLLALLRWRRAEHRSQLKIRICDSGVDVGVRRADPHPRQTRECHLIGSAAEDLRALGKILIEMY
jgi:hypothetical protein